MIPRGLYYSGQNWLSLLLIYLKTLIKRWASAAAVRIIYKPAKYKPASESPEVGETEGGDGADDQTSEHFMDNM